MNLNGVERVILVSAEVLNSVEVLTTHSHTNEEKERERENEDKTKTKNPLESHYYEP